MLKLYYAQGTCALASHVALEEAGAQYETVRLDFAKGDQRKPEYLKVNPKGRVPALATDRGILTETPAILAYVAQVHPKANLAPLGDPFAFARAQSFNSYLCSTAHVNHAHLMRGNRWADEASSLEDMKRKVPKNVAESFALMESGMVEGPWVMGSAYTICDPYLFTLARWLERDGVDIARFPKIHDHHRRMEARPAVKKVLEEWARP
ncbi:MAG: glutathione S-transferase family protein [Burkholderiales bacterium]|nr:glutathione S-transferase family protein [Burkholderiales bacterium]